MTEHDSSPAARVFSFGPFRLVATERLLEREGKPLVIGGRALDILIALVERAGQVVGREELISRVWPNLTVEEANLRVHVSGLRKALGDGKDGARYLMNVPGRGYCFVASVTHPVRERALPPPDVASTGRLAKLPARLGRMVGRDGTVRLLSTQLMTWRFVSIVGPGGMGKTTVAVSVAHALFDGFGGAIFFVDLAALTDPRLVTTAVASALGLIVQTQDPLLGLLAFIGDKKSLVVLDNCEHVIDAVAALAERIVDQAPEAHVLATSREALRAQGEHVHLLRALDCPPEDAVLTAADALRYPAAQLFMDRAAASGYGAELSDADAPTVSRICRRLDGVALAIEFAASQAGSHGILGIAELLDNRFKLLWQGRRTALSRHQTLNAMLDWSYNLLSDHDKLVLCRLSVFVGDFTFSAACFVAAEGEDVDVADAVAGLVAKSLISTSFHDGATFYRLLDTTRAYTAAKLSKRGEADRTARRHAISYSGFLRKNAIIQSRLGSRNLALYSRHIGNVRAALEWALSDRGDATLGIQLASAAAPLFVGLSSFEECRQWCERALAVLDDIGRGSKHEMMLQEALALSSMYTKGHGNQVRSAIERGLTLAESFEDRPRQLQLLAGLNLFLNRLGDFRDSLAAAEDGRAIAQAAGDPAGAIWAEWVLGISHYLMGNQTAAQHHCERGLTLAAEHGALNTIQFGCDHRIRALVALARALWLRGFFDQALRIAQKAIDDAVSGDQPVSICVSLMYSSSVFLWTGNWQPAEDFIERLIVYAGQYSMEPYRAAGLALRGELAVARGQAEAGVDLLRRALEIMHAEQYGVVLTTFTGALAEGLRLIGQFESALFTVNGAIAQATNSGGTFHLAELLRIKAEVLAARRERESAIDCLGEALSIAHEQSALALELRSTIGFSRMLAETGQHEQARHALAIVYDRFTEGFETPDLQAARRLLAELTYA